MSYTNLPESSNYVEFVFKSFSIEDDEFAYIFKNIKETFNVCFQHRFVKYIIGDKIYEYYDNDKKLNIKTYQNTPLSYEYDKPHFKILYYKRSKIPYYMFPSQKNVDSSVYVNKYVFRIHSNIYLNFETTTYEDGKYYNKIYINYNHEERLEENIIKKCIEDAKNAIIKSIHGPSVAIF